MLTLLSDAALTTDIRPETGLLLCCARTRVSFETAVRIRRLLRADLDWPSLTRTALRHGSLPLLCWNLSNLCPKAVPPDAMDQLRTHFHANAQHNLALTRELLQLLKLLETSE